MAIRNRVIGLRFVKADSLIPNPANWRKHPKAQREALQAMLDRVGWADAVIARETPEGLVLVDGHLRADLDANAEVPVLVVDLDEAEAGQVLATLDPLAAMAEANTEALSKLLQEVTVPIDLGDLFPTLPGLVPEPPPAPDDVVEPVADPVTKRGDIWQLGRHRLMCGDATNAEDVARLLDGAKPDCILTDPPYSSGGFQEAGRSAGSKGSDAVYKPIENDRRSTRGYMALMKQILSAVTPVDVIYVFTDWRMWVNLFDVVEGSGQGVRSMIVWDKGTPGMGMGWRAQHELILCATRQNGLWKRHMGAQGNVITLPRQANELHATQKPVALLETILATTPFAEMVYDPFVGSGTTIIAAERQGRICYAMEIDPGYVDAAVKRWEAYTGEKGILT